MFDLRLLLWRPEANAIASAATFMDFFLEWRLDEEDPSNERIDEDRRECRRELPEESIRDTRRDTRRGVDDAELD